jgi:hypothetical protein
VRRALDTARRTGTPLRPATAIDQLPVAAQPGQVAAAITQSAASVPGLTLTARRALHTARRADAPLRPATAVDRLPVAGPPGQAAATLTGTPAATSSRPGTTTSDRGAATTSRTRGAASSRPAAAASGPAAAASGSAAATPPAASITTAGFSLAVRRALHTARRPTTPLRPATSVDRLPVAGQSGPLTTVPARVADNAAAARRARGAAPATVLRRQIVEAPGFALSVRRALHTTHGGHVAVRPATSVDRLPVAGSAEATVAAVRAVERDPRRSGDTVLRRSPATGRLRPGARHDTVRRLATPAPPSRGGEIRSTNDTRLASIDMPDLMPLRRASVRGKQAGRAGSLATGFGAVEVIVPAGASGGAGRPPTASEQLFAGRNPQHPQNLSSLRQTARPESPLAAGDTVQHTPAASTYLPAPPPVGIRRSPAGSTGVSRSSAARARGTIQRTATSTRATMISRLAEMEAASAVAPPVPAVGLAQAEQGGSYMTDVQPIRVTNTGPPVTPESLLNDRRWFDQLVERIVDRIERHVVDELERRGRRHGSGAF